MLHIFKTLRLFLINLSTNGHKTTAAYYGHFKKKSNRTYDLVIRMYGLVICIKSYVRFSNPYERFTKSYVRFTYPYVRFKIL